MAKTYAITAPTSRPVVNYKDELTHIWCLRDLSRPSEAQDTEANSLKDHMIFYYDFASNLRIANVFGASVEDALLHFKSQYDGVYLSVLEVAE